MIVSRAVAFIAAKTPALLAEKGVDFGQEVKVPVRMQQANLLHVPGRALVNDGVEVIRADHTNFVVRKGLQTKPRQFGW